MKCKECNCAEKGWFKSKPDAYVCIGVQEPFVIKDINVECTEYPEYRNRKPSQDIAEAISHFKYGISHDIFSEPVTSYAKMAVKALEKQIPKKPTKLTDTLLIDTGWIYKCPTCGLACGENKYHLEVTQDEFYCTQCGQKLDWE